jgi:hypothetical protein
MDDKPKTMHFETRVKKGISATIILAMFSRIGGWIFLIGLGWLILNQFSNPKTMALILIGTGIILKYSFLGLMHYRARELLKKQ